ncbi:MAG TPA: glycosyltransferase family 4 protein [Vicinamibacterales bacterium]|nr:glycosyltransferase family 4 protein [Vicinamibacterales bacterium]
MHILMIAPEPFFEPRGTPFSEFHRIRALTTLGHTVDLVTYPFGRDVEMPGLRIFRCLRPPFVHRVRIGPSWAKVPLDMALAVTALRRALGGKYDAVHSHEEGGAIGVVLSRLLGIPHLYDMHSSLPQQVENFGVRHGKLLARMLGWVERLMIGQSKVVIVICQDLEDTVRAGYPDVPTVLIENASGAGPALGAGPAVKRELGLSADTPVVLYTGTFEAYQGLDLLYDAMARVVRSRPDARLVMVGGEPGQVEAARQQVSARGLAGVVVFTGQRPPDDVPKYLDAASALVSPRSGGTNTPLKIYQYLRSGRPIVATRLRTHTQVLDDDSAVLVEPTAEAFADGILRVLTDPALAARVGARAIEVAAEKYSDEAFIEKTRRAFRLLADDGPAATVGDAA